LARSSPRRVRTSTLRRHRGRCFAAAQHDRLDEQDEAVDQVRPAAVAEPAVGVLLATAGRLHDAIKADERDRDELAHDSSRTSTPR
jgi:hypothetical protein